MIYSYTRIASLALAFGFFFGCSVIKNSSNTSSGPIAGDLTKQQLAKRLDAIQNELGDTPNNPKLYYEKGLLLTKWTQKKQQPSQRTPLYREADKALFTADSLIDHSPTAKIDSSIQTDQLRRVAWTNEHNQGIKVSQNARSKNDFLRSATHFSNAAAIMPDSVTSYQKAGEAFYNADSLPEAIQILENARRHIDPLPVELLESLGYLYLETDNADQAVPVFEKARTLDQRNFNIMHGLSNAYIRSGRHQKAITLLQLLTERQPNNTTYQLALGAQLYEAGNDQLKLLVNNLNDQQKFEEQFFTVANSFMDRAEEQYNAIVGEKSSNKEIITTVAQFHQNRAAQYQKLLPYLPSSKKKNIASIIERSISASIPLLQQLAKQNPSDQVWQSLYQAYNYLGMQEEAQKAKANI
ncbi:tetratricopeptide repeat protein [Fodinibius salsisoli]|uniref:Tetratricopeptide repeat protein n=1 Tax=Fodinibius salsisoli TaxID=2820877 RepID=A0ABT3PIX0_9BACT|nr:tetratricopeptide repeat protein [Fodinibius salsisoli]MCW9705890.1 tetratricopeptide repeat protein [Fodinibius salsisoli]